MRIATVAQPVPLHRAFDYEVPERLQGSARPGSRVRAPFGPARSLVGTIIAVRDGQPHRPLKPIDSVVDDEPLLSPDLLELAQWLSKRWCAPIGECCKALLPAFVTARPIRGTDPALEAVEQSPHPLFELTRGQAGAVESLSARLGARRFHAALLYGVPASGKTEVYLRLIRQVVEDGGQVLYLLPEISLTRPFFDDLRRRAGLPVALWHSRLGVRERRAVWLGLRRGDVSVVVGARSACLLPFRGLRLVVVDEEQDESYKQEGQAPLYHARDVALERARRAGALAVLGSATPSLEAVALSQGAGLELLRMPERVSPLERPRVELLERPARRGGCLSEELVEALRLRLERGDQAILLVNRRGFSNFAVCRKCGWVMRCPSCHLAFIRHQGEKGFGMLCHHCGRKAPEPSACVACAAAPVSFAGVGTQQVVAELLVRLPAARVLRMDGDTAQRERRLYDRFLSRQADILVGTKLVAKGFHFPDVTLVGVVDSDTMLHMPDFRSAERTVQLLLQASGRAGRADKPGEVLLQTAAADHYALQAVARGDYLRFAEVEIAHRDGLGYPPRSPLVRLVFSGVREQAAAGAALRAAERVAAAYGESVEVLGPAPAVLLKVRGRFRHHVLVKFRDPTGLERFPALAETLETPVGVRLQVNVDPYDLF